MTTDHSHSDALCGCGDALTEEQRIALVWQQFNSDFATEQSCMERIYEHALEMHLLECLHCGSSQFARTYGERVAICSNCGKKKWLTSRTFFDHIKKGRPYLALFCFKDQGVNINPNQFHKLVGVAYSTAQAMFKKVDYVIQSNMQESHVHSALFAELIARRSLETPARSSPIAEQEAAEKKHLADEQSHSSDQAVLPATTNDTAATKELCEAQQDLDGGASSSDVPHSSAKGIGPPGVPFSQDTALIELSEQEVSVYGLLSETPVHFDTICQNTAMKSSEASAVVMCLELAGLVKRTIGDWYTRRSAKDAAANIMEPALLSVGSASPDAALKSVKDAIRYIYAVYKGISRKYLQLYLAAHWCNRDRARWRPGSLISACYRFGCIPYGLIRAYVTPLTVKTFNPDQNGNRAQLE